MYDMDMCQYEPAIARWVVHDPIVHHSQSSYSAFNNNPVYWADPSGMAGKHYNFNTSRYEDNNGKTVTFGEAMGSQGLNVDRSKKSTESSNSSNSEVGSNTISDINPKEAMNYQAKYPRTMRVLRQLQNYVKSNPKILEVLAEFSGYSTMEVLSQLKYSEGMTSIIRDLHGTLFVQKV